MGATQTIPVDEAESDFRGILERVEHGETFVISRHGQKIARISPETQIDSDKVAQAVEGMRELRKRIGRMTLDEILSARDEGRR